MVTTMEDFLHGLRMSNGNRGAYLTIAAMIPADLLEDLVAANRILAAQGVLDAYGHVSVRSPGDASRFYLSRSLAPSLVTAADIQEYGADSEPIADTRK